MQKQNILTTLPTTCSTIMSLAMQPGVVSWDNGVVGNYWGDYSGSGYYVIDENNTDHHPLTQPVDVNSIAPTPTPSSTIGSLISEPTILAILIGVPLLVIIISLLLFRRNRKTISQNKPNV